MTARKSSVEAPEQRFHRDPNSNHTPSATCFECKGVNGHNPGCQRAKRPKPFNYIDYPLTGYAHSEPKVPLGPWEQFKAIAKELDGVTIEADNGKATVSLRDIEEASLKGATPWATETPSNSASHGSPEQPENYTLPASASHREL